MRVESVRLSVDGCVRYADLVRFVVTNDYKLKFTKFNNLLHSLIKS